MSKTVKLETINQDLVETIQQFLKSLLELEEIEAVLVPQHLLDKRVVMPSLISDPRYIEQADPLAPSFPINAAKLVSKLTRKPYNGTVAAVLRSCEIRAFTELVKLKQGSRENLVIVGIDCPGTYTNTDYPLFAKGEGLDSTRRFLKQVLGGGDAAGSVEIAPACHMCERPVAENADISIGLFGLEGEDHLLIQASGDKGEALIDKLKLKEGAESIKRKESIKKRVDGRVAYRDQVCQKTGEAVSTMEGLSNYLADCINCYNCRVACPVCYCNECVMLTDVFDHEPLQYVRWSQQRGFLKMPTDTVFYHLTRFAHMSLSCVGCGQCSNACPNNIPLAELFKTISHQTQQAFDYEAGIRPDDRLPLSLFEENELQEVVGLKHKSA